MKVKPKNTAQVGPHTQNGKHLGSLLDTKLDIKRRNGLLIDAYNTLEYMFISRHLSEQTKLRIFKAYLESVFLYNSELWCMTKSIADQIDTSSKTTEKDSTYLLAKNYNK